MGRPNKIGLEYFSMDVDFFDDIKIRRMIKSNGVTSVPILIYLLCNAYKENGYYIEWCDDMPFLIADKVGVTEGAVQEVVQKALQVGFFSEEMFQKHNILTSRSIQERYLRATIRRDNNCIDKRFSLINDNDNTVIVDRNSINVDKNQVNDNRSTQSKVNKRKENTKEDKPIGLSKKDGLSSSSRESIFSDIMKCWNDTLSGKLVAVKSMTDKRKKSVMARLKESGEDSYRQVFANILKSNFLLGNNKNGWKCDFDWVFSPSNYVRILEGSFGIVDRISYDKKQRQKDAERLDTLKLIQENSRNKITYEKYQELLNRANGGDIEAKRELHMI